MLIQKLKFVRRDNSLQENVELFFRKSCSSDVLQIFVRAVLLAFMA